MDPLIPYDLIVIGGGAAGFFGAINAAEAKPGLKVLILEASPRVLTKVKVSGGGRCNVTHHMFDPQRLIKNYPRGHKELLGPFHRFGPEQTVQWFAAHGVQLKIEDDGRMFPISDSSQSIIDALQTAREQAGVELRTKALVQSIKRQDSGFELQLKDGLLLHSRWVLVATGSLAFGTVLLEQLGHQLVPPVPSLFTFMIQDPLLSELAGQSFSRVKAELRIPGIKRPFVQEGAVLITHWGLSGPAILKLSAFAARELQASHYQAQLKVEWGLDEARCLQSILACKEAFPKKQLSNENPLPCSKRFWERLLQLQVLDPTKTWAQLSRKEMQGLAKQFAGSELQVDGKGVFKEEFVTAGGLARQDLDFRTMESHLCPGLYLAGEVLDVDGVTGGFNFQNAWTGGWLAAQHIASRPG